MCGPWALRYYGCFKMASSDHSEHVRPACIARFLGASRWRPVTSPHAPDPPSSQYNRDQWLPPAPCGQIRNSSSNLEGVPATKPRQQIMPPAAVEKNKEEEA